MRAILLVVLCLAVAVAVAHKHKQQCSNRADCAYNGECVAGKCNCVSQYIGAQCDQFNFEPHNHGEGLRTVQDNGQQVSSWGGSVLLAEDGTYHMWAAEMTEGTGIKAWITNSQVVHAVAGPDFRFLRQEVVFPVFAHEPTVSRAPTGEWVMYFTTNYGEKSGSQCNPPCTCSNGNGSSCLSCPNDQQCTANPRSPMSTRMSFASHPDGPWSTPVLVPAPTSGDTNLACVIHANSSLTCMGPGLGMLFSSDWRKVSQYHWYEPKGEIRGEDPMLYVDPHDLDVLHCVTHGGGWGDPFGFHYWSTDGGHSW